MSLLRINGIEPESIVDGKGFRYTVFTQGCPHACAGCHNPQTHAFDGGRLIEIERLFEDFRQNPLLQGMTFSGGEPFCQPKPLYKLAKLVHGLEKDVTVYTGYLYEALLKMPDPYIAALLSETDVLVDGPFLLREKDLTLRFRGSRNQRILDMAQTRAAGRPVLDKELMSSAD